MHRLRKARFAAVVAALSLMGACSTPAPVLQAPTVAIVTTDLLGKWGLASYRVDTDLERTKGEAKAACANPYVVTQGPSGGAMMYLADQSTASEVFLKSAPDGRVYIGPEGKPGDKRDRLVVSHQSGILVTQWVDPDAASRYGTLVFVRCTAT